MLIASGSRCIEDPEVIRKILAHLDEKVTPTGSGTVCVALRTGIGVNERWYGVESSTGNSIFVKFRGDLTEKREKLMQKTASVPVSFMEKGFNATYTLE